MKWLVAKALLGGRRPSLGVARKALSRSTLCALPRLRRRIQLVSLMITLARRAKVYGADTGYNRSAGIIPSVGDAEFSTLRIYQQSGSDGGEITAKVEFLDFLCLNRLLGM